MLFYFRCFWLNSVRSFIFTMRTVLSPCVTVLSSCWGLYALFAHVEKQVRFLSMSVHLPLPVCGSSCVLSCGAIEAPQGLRGGMPGGRSRFIVNPGTPAAEDMPSSARLHLEAGNTFSVQPPGGGGYGDPAKRDPEALADDIAEGFVTEAAARRDHGKGSTRT